MKRIALILATTAVAAPAFAGGPAQVVAEPTIVAPAPVLVNQGGDWSGYYAGGQLGYGDFDVKGGDASLAKPNGFTAGVQGGYRWDFGKTVVGVEAALSAGDMTTSDKAAKIKQKADLKAQIGYDMGSSLIYATAGATWAKAEMNGHTGTENGWLAGVGYDYDLGNNWVVGAEYQYNKFENVAGTTHDIDGSTFALRANYKF